MDKRIKLDKNLLIVLSVILLAGIFLQYTANYPGDQTFFKNHLIWVGISLTAGFLILFFPLNGLKDIASILYIIGIILLIIVLFLPGSDGRWIRIGFFQFQPSEVMKLFFIIFLSKILSKVENKKVNMTDLRLPIAIAAVPVFLVFIEPDIGTSAIFLFVFLGIIATVNISIPRYILFVSPLISLLCGFNLISWILFMILLIATIMLSDLDIRYSIGVFLLNLVVGASTPIIQSLLKPYQRDRLLNFLNPSLDPTGAGWQLLQSKISIGSGGIIGKGYLNGAIKNLGFLPQTRTDFIFAVFRRRIWIFRNSFYSYPFYFISSANPPHSTTRAKIFRTLPCIRDILLFSITDNGQYSNDCGSFTGCGDTSSFYKLWRNFAFGFHNLCGTNPFSQE